MDGRVDGWRRKRENGDFLSGGVGGGDGGLRLGRVAQAAGREQEDAGNGVIPLFQVVDWRKGWWIWRIEWHGCIQRKVEWIGWWMDL